MSLSRSIATNTFFQVGGKILGLILSLIAAGLIFPYLGEAGVGQYTAILSLLQIFGIVMDFGLYIVLIKRLSDIEDSTQLQVDTIFTLRLLSGIFFLSLAPLTAWIIGWYSDFYSTEIIWGVLLTTLFFLCISLNQLLAAVFQKFLHTEWIAIAELIGKIVLLITSLVVIGYQLNLLWVMGTLVIGSVINFGILFIASRRYMPIHLRLDWAIAKSVVQEAWPIGVSIAFALLYFKGDTVILTFYESAQTIGEYGAPYKILEVLITFPAIFTGLVLSPLTKAWQKKQYDRFQILLQKSFELLALIAIPMVASTLVLAPYIMDVLVPEGFVQSDGILRILMIATGSIFLGTLFGYAVPALQKQRSMMWAYIVIAILSLGAYLIVIPRYSIVGAAWITVASEVAVCISAFAIVWRTTQVRLRFLPIVYMCVAAAILWGVLLWSTPLITEWLSATADFSPRILALILLAIVVPCGALFYCILLLVTGVVRFQDIKVIITKS